MLEDEENQEFLDRYKFKKNEGVSLYHAFVKKINMHSRSENFLHKLVTQMELDFKEPEEDIIQWNTFETDPTKLFMYFIQRGEC